jgi:hypothetical protein
MMDNARSLWHRDGWWRVMGGGGGGRRIEAQGTSTCLGEGKRRDRRDGKGEGKKKTEVIQRTKGQHWKLL